MQFTFSVISNHATLFTENTNLFINAMVILIYTITYKIEETLIPTSLPATPQDTICKKSETTLSSEDRLRP